MFKARELSVVGTRILLREFAGTICRDELDDLYLLEWPLFISIHEADDWRSAAGVMPRTCTSIQVPTAAVETVCSGPDPMCCCH